MKQQRNPARTGARLFGAWFAFCALISLGVLGVLVWAVITLVHHFA